MAAQCRSKEVQAVSLAGASYEFAITKIAADHRRMISIREGQK
jgi:hypothetical protein